MQSDEEKKAKMRAYYQANKKKWWKYKQTRVTKVTPDEFKAIQREASRANYVANREKIIERTSQYQRENKEWSAAYQAQWHQENKTEINERRKERYHEVIRPKELEQKENAPYIRLSEAAAILNINLRRFRELAYTGKLPNGCYTRTPGGIYLIQRSSLDDLKQFLKKESN